MAELNQTSFSNLVPLLSYAESISADPKVLRRQASRLGALIERGKVDFIDIPAFDEAQREELEKRNRIKAEKRTKSRSSSGSLATVDSIGLLISWKERYGKLIPRKKSKITALKSKLDHENDPGKRQILSRNIRVLEGELGNMEANQTNVETRLKELISSEQPDTTEKNEGGEVST